MSDLISVIIPAYNKPKELKRSISSVLNQTYQNFEILIVDDFSVENIKEVIESFGDNRLKYYRLEKKGNANVARNLGIKKASGEYIAMLDSDDEWLPIHLERRIQKIIEWNCDGIYGSAFVKDKELDYMLNSRPLYKGEKMINYLLADNCSATSPSHFYKSDCAKNILWDETLLRHQDLDFSCRFSERYSFYCDNKATIIINRKETVKLTDNHFLSCATFINQQKKYIDKSIYPRYLSRMLHHANLSNSKKYISFYKKEIKKNIAFFSLNRFLSSLQPRNTFNRVVFRLKFIFWVILK